MPLDPSARRTSTCPRSRGEEKKSGFDRRFGLDAVHLVADPDPHAGIVEGLHPGVDLAIVELLQDAL